LLDFTAQSIFEKGYQHMNQSRESRTLAALRDALLPKLLSGELRMPAAAGKLAEVCP